MPGAKEPLPTTGVWMRRRTEQGHVTVEDHREQMVAILQENVLKAENIHSHSTKKKDPAIKYQPCSTPWLDRHLAQLRTNYSSCSFRFLWLPEEVCPLLSPTVAQSAPWPGLPHGSTSTSANKQGGPWGHTFPSKGRTDPVSKNR